MTMTLEKGECSLGTQQDHHKKKRAEDRECTEPKDKKTEHSTSIEKKQGPKTKIPKPTGDKST
jgi:hypothetical protein